MQVVEGDDAVLRGLKVFVVEDESLVAMQMEDILADYGCQLVGLGMRVKQALTILADLPAIDAAILDVNIGGEKVYAVAEALRARAVPMVFATGYGRSGVEAEWQAYPVLQKPYGAEEVVVALCAAVRPS